METLEVSYRIEYGHKRYHPENDAAKKLASIKRYPTFTQEQITMLRELGLEIRVVVPQEEL